MNKKPPAIRTLLLATALLCAALATSFANVSVTPLFGNHMVIQRDKPVPVYGTASPGETVTVKLNGQQLSTTADAQGNWQVTLSPMAANATAQNLTITGNNTVTITDVLIGDVWLCSGQSNMEWNLGACNRQAEDVSTANFPGIRQFGVPAIWANDPTKNLSGNWTVCSPSTAAGFGAVGFYFARKIYQDQNGTIPIGLLQAPRGATSIDPWLAPEGLSDLPDIQPLYSQSILPYGPFSLFNGTIYPLAPYALTGAIWYQGEARETTFQHADSYYVKEKALQRGWQRLWGMDKFPLYIVLLANYTNPPTGSNPAPDMPGTTWADTRIQQMNILGLPNTGVASALDVGEANDIHPKDKLDVGERLALWALKNEYGRTTIVPSGPVLKDVTVANGKATCTFDYVGAGLMVGSKTPYQPTVEAPAGTPLARFSIAGATGGWYDATAVISGNTVVLSSTSVTTPKKVAYACWTNPSGANLYNRDGLPAAPFYVDDVAAKYTVTASAGTGGTISPSGATTYLKRKTALYTITPNAGYSIQDVKVDGVSVGAAVKTYTFDPLYANHTISATFAQTTPSYTVTTSASNGGSISPSGTITIAQGGSRTFSVVPNPGAQVAALTVDGAPVGNRTIFTFSDVRRNHTISASFMCKITASPGYGGSISPAASTMVPYGGTQTYTITPNPGFTLTDVKVDGTSVGAVTSYTFNNVTTAHTISATFGGGEGSNGYVPKIYHLLFSAVTDSFLTTSGSTWNWPTYIPSGKTLTMMGTPTVETISGVKWEKNIYEDADGYSFGTYSLPINCQGASIVMAVKPTRNGVSSGWVSCVDAFYDRLTLGIKNDTGQVVVRRNGSIDASTTTVPDGQITILSLVVQPTGQYKVYANGVKVMDITSASNMTALVPGIAGAYANTVTLGHGTDTWTTFNGNMGDVYFYTTALTDDERRQLEAGLTSKFASGGTTTYTISSSAGIGGTINPSGTVIVTSGWNQTFNIAPSTGYTIADVKVDNVSVGAVTSYTFNSVTANHTISVAFDALPVTVTGKVTDQATGAALSGASVYFSTAANLFPNPYYKATTDASGNYSLSIPVRTWYAAAAKTAYDMSAFKEVTITAGSSPTVNFALSLTPIPDTEVFYKFDETSGTTASEASGSGKNGTLVNGPVWTTGKSGNCLSFDGTNDYVAVPDLGSYSSITIAAWVNMDTLGTDSTGSAILSCNGTTAGDAQLLIRKDTGQLQFTMAGSPAASTALSNYKFTAAELGKWRHIAVTYSTSNKVVQFYINGAYNAANMFTTTSKPTLNGGVSVGSWSGSRYFDGKIDDFHIHGRALSSSEIAAIVNSSSSMRIADAKKLADGEMVTLGDKVVVYAPRTAAGARATNYFYIEEPDRSAGLFVQRGPGTTEDVYEDSSVTVSGIMKTSSYRGQRYIETSVRPGPGTAVAVEPLGMTTKSVLTDASSIGLLVRVAGKVTELSTAEGWFNIRDGYGVDTLVICETSIPFSGFALGDTVAVTGTVGKDAIFTADPVAIIYLRSVVKL